METKIKNLITVAIAQKIKFLGLSIIKDVQGLSNESYKMIMKQNKED